FYWLSVTHCTWLLLQGREIVLELVLNAISLIGAGVAGDLFAPVPYGYLNACCFHCNFFTHVLNGDRVTVCVKANSGEGVAAGNALSNWLHTLQRQRSKLVPLNGEIFPHSLAAAPDLVRLICQATLKKELAQLLIAVNSRYWDQDILAKPTY